jgi:hypothetical protein
MQKMTDQHNRTFGLRDDLAAAVTKLIESDARSNWDTDIADGRLVFDFAEQLIALGWVVDYPDEKADTSSTRTDFPLAG